MTSRVPAPASLPPNPSPSASSSPDGRGINESNKRPLSASVASTGPNKQWRPSASYQHGSRASSSPHPLVDTGEGRRQIPMELSVQNMKISDIIEDKFMFGRMSKTEEARLEKIRLRGYQPPTPASNPSHPATSSNPNATASNTPTETRSKTGRTGPQLVMTKDGQFRLDQTSLIIKPQNEDLPHEVDDERAKVITSASFRRNAKSNPLKWNQQETELFYEVGLSSIHMVLLLPCFSLSAEARRLTLNSHLVSVLVWYGFWNDCQHVSGTHQTASQD